MSDVVKRAAAWVAGDPDAETRAMLQDAIDREDLSGLESMMGQPLAFGTAGIRGEVGPGPARMNRAVVMKTTWGLAKYLNDHSGPGTVVVAFDARPTSRTFAEDTVGVLVAAGYAVAYFSQATPTPVAAFAAKELDALAAVVVTASHNPPQDNGYKVYGRSAAQIVSPVDQLIQDNLAQSAPANEIPRVEHLFAIEHHGVRQLGIDMVDRYTRDVLKTRSRRKGSDLDVVYTPIHGVGWETLHHVMEAAGHRFVTPVPAQVVPDGTFPTVEFPNPEEPGALDLARDLAESRRADLIVATDPDADRLAVVIPAGGDWRPLSGNEIGVLLGEYLLTNYKADIAPIVASSIVSSPMFGLVARKHDAVFERTLTGFKWIMTAGLSREQSGDGQFLFGYEEALGYSVGRTVRDKDGISAALLFVDLVADLADQGRTVLDELARLWNAHGLWVSSQTSIVRDGHGAQEALVTAVDNVASDPPTDLGGLAVSSVTDYRSGADSRPVWLGSQDLVELQLGERGRVLVRPSGTEPKLKIYVDLCETTTGVDLEDERARLQEQADELGSLLDASLEL